MVTKNYYKNMNFKALCCKVTFFWGAKSVIFKNGHFKNVQNQNFFSNFFQKIFNFYNFLIKNILKLEHYALKSIFIIIIHYKIFN